MKWTQQHSRNAVAAKARKRMAPRPWIEPMGKATIPRKSRAAITIQIRDREIGDSLTLNLHRSPWPNHWSCMQGEYSTARIGEAVKHLLNAAARRPTARPATAPKSR